MTELAKTTKHRKKYGKASFPKTQQNDATVLTVSVSITFTFNKSTFYSLDHAAYKEHDLDKEPFS